MTKKGHGKGEWEETASGVRTPRKKTRDALKERNYRETMVKDSKSL